MTDRIIDISQHGARLRVEHAQLVIEPQPTTRSAQATHPRDAASAEQDGARGRRSRELFDEPSGQDARAPRATVPLDEIAVLSIAHPRVRLSHAVLRELTTAGGMVVCCDEAHLPVGMMLPLQGHFLIAERFRLQADAPAHARKRAWQQVVRAKIAAQSRLLLRLRGDDNGIAPLIDRVRSGDPDNIEAQAAQRYWRVLFGDKTFRRDRDGNNQNRHLNYGYAVLRAIVARAICAAGLLPTFGLHHHNRTSAFVLADDLMEPFRPIVDHAVVRLIEREGADQPLRPATKRSLIEPLQAHHTALNERGEIESRTLFDWCNRICRSLLQALTQYPRTLFIPRFDP